VYSVQVRHLSTKWAGKTDNENTRRYDCEGQLDVMQDARAWLEVEWIQSEQENSHEGELNPPQQEKNIKIICLFKMIHIFA
jgi:hypothetical protein